MFRSRTATATAAATRTTRTAAWAASVRTRPTRPTTPLRSAPPPPPSSYTHTRHNSQFQPLRPPSPADLGAPRRARQYVRTRRWARRVAVVVAVGWALAEADRRVYASSVRRTLRTFGVGLLVAADYKLNFRPAPLPVVGRLLGWQEDVGALHLRSAARLARVLRQNGGLYLKMGQAIALQSAVLPPAFQRMFARMYDDAPQASWAAVEAVIRGDFGGRSVEEVFGVSFSGQDGEGKGLMERYARASASVAQVHWARLPDGREVAVKIQKPEIATQMGWDLWAFRTVARVYSACFDLPLYSLVPYVNERIALETDFANEARNAETMRALVAAEPALRGRVYVPAVVPALSSPRVLTAEWIEGVPLWDRDAITAPWRDPRGYAAPSPGMPGRPLTVDLDEIHQKLRHSASPYTSLKPDRRDWRGPRGTGGLGLGAADVSTTLIDLFAAQMFRWGVVHCDPHPGNLLVRRRPGGAGAQLVLLDHGLYVTLSPRLRRQYCAFWTSMLALDDAGVAELCAEWGIRAPELFASTVLLRPYRGGGDAVRRDLLADLADDATPAERHYAMQARMKQGLRDVLADEDRWPKEFVFLGRSMRIVQAIHQRMGSPINRVKRMGRWAAAETLTLALHGRSADDGRPVALRVRAAAVWRYLVFRAVLVVSDLFFYFYRARQLLGLGGGLEDEVEARMRDVARDYGVELQHEVFD